MTKETYIKTAYIENGELKKGFIPSSKAYFHNNNEIRKWTPELETHKKNRVIWLKQRITQIDEMLAMELDEWDRLKYSLFRDQLHIDLREDTQQIEHKGNIPKHIDERCIKKSEKTHQKYMKMLGKEKFIKLNDEVHIELWGWVQVEDKTTGGGKV